MKINRRASELAKIRAEDRWHCVEYGSKLHSDAASFKEAVHAAFALKANPKLRPDSQPALTDRSYNQAVEMFRIKFMDAYKRKNGDFFRALGDVLARDNSSAARWGSLEKYIFTQCEIAQELGEPMPSAGQFLRAWKIGCGIVPTRLDDLKFLWDSFIGGPIPSSRQRIEAALRPHLGPPNHAAASIQIKQVLGAAKNVGITLPKQTTRNCLPAGFCVTSD